MRLRRRSRLAGKILIPDVYGFIRSHCELGGQLGTFVGILERHIELDGEEHGPMALRMVAELCGERRGKWREAEEAAVFAVESRLRLWDGILAASPRSRSSVQFRRGKTKESRAQARLSFVSIAMRALSSLESQGLDACVQAALVTGGRVLVQNALLDALVHQRRW